MYLTLHKFEIRLFFGTLYFFVTFAFVNTSTVVYLEILPIIAFQKIYILIFSVDIGPPKIAYISLSGSRQSS